jgi:hypothetical protein
LGRRAPVAIEVAIAFAVSWKPFVKSKISAVTTTTTTMTDSSMIRAFQDAGMGNQAVRERDVLSVQHGG